LSYAGLQEEQDRAAVAGGGEEDIADMAALEKIAKASRPTDVASKPAIAAHILAQREAEKQMEAITGDTGQKAPSTLKIKPKPKPKSTTVKAAAVAAVAAEAEEEVSSAPIAQIEKKIQKRTKKAAKVPEEDTKAASGGPAAAAPKRQTKKKTDL
jgi:2-oxoglutarate dehydrogenase complex dehydrogenase (E1) component-like enzyme